MFRIERETRQQNRDDLPTTDRRGSCTAAGRWLGRATGESYDQRQHDQAHAMILQAVRAESSGSSFIWWPRYSWSSLVKLSPVAPHQAITVISAKTPMGSAVRLRDKAIAQADLGRAEAILRSGRAFLFE